MDSSIVFVDSNENSGNSSIGCVSYAETQNSPEICYPAEITALRRLSKNLESIFQSPEFSYFSDAKIVVDGADDVPVHRCILSARSPFFKALFSSSDDERGGKFELKQLLKDFNVGFYSLVSVLAYLYNGQVRPLPEGVCVCVDDDCSHEGCQPAVVFMLEVLYASFTFQISELVALYQRHLLDILEKVATDDILVILKVAKLCDKACERLLLKCIDIVVKSDIDVVMLEKALPLDVVKQILCSRSELGLCGPESNSVPCKHVQKILKALDSDDVELVTLLLKEGHTTLDEAYALHYAVAYCDAKTTTELLDLELADVNHRNPRGYTVLHVAARRKEPNIIGSLLTKGARTSELTLDGRKALQISKRLTRYVDYQTSIEKGKPSPKDKLCIEVLELEEMRYPLIGEASVSLSMEGNDVRTDLLYLENRVSLAKLLFPSEAKVAMDIAQVDGTLEFTLAVNSRSSSAGHKRPVDSYEPPSKIEEKHQNRQKALSKTVELGKRFFPRCSAELNKIMDVDNLSELAYLGEDTPETQLMKKKRFMEIQDNLMKAFSEDKEELDRSGVWSTSSVRVGVPRPNGRLTSRNK